ncbi:MAG: amino acid deaminase/aldolase [Thermoleophilaceae bacterium]|nr:amino acid deaminase/aldolase [Thermoleophilaceae bacterium]
MASALDPAARLARYEELFSDRGSPFAFIDLDAMWSNSRQMLDRADGVPIRIASKSLRCAPLVRRILESDGRYRGQLTFTLAESLWLAEQGFEDLLLAYPCVDLEVLAALSARTAEHPGTAPAIVVDSVAHLDLIDKVHSGGAPVRVAIDVDCAYWTAGDRVKLGPKRSPIHTPDEAVALAREIDRRAGSTLVGMMFYEGQIAGLGDNAPGLINQAKNRAIREIQKRSVAELAERRAQIVDAVRKVSSIEFVNGGGTGSLHTTSKEEAVTDIAAGSGFYAPTLFDTYTSFRLEPAAIFGLPIVRKPSASTATALGGGYLASGVGAKDRMPSPYLPEGLKLDGNEGAGEVQTPLLGKAAGSLEVGDRVYMRHTKAGELCERFNSLLLVEGYEIIDEVATYRGEGHAFL